MYDEDENAGYFAMFTNGKRTVGFQGTLTRKGGGGTCYDEPSLPRSTLFFILYSHPTLQCLKVRPNVTEQLIGGWDGCRTAGVHYAIAMKENGGGWDKKAGLKDINKLNSALTDSKQYQWGGEGWWGVQG